jgi:hypothetical protein
MPRSLHANYEKKGSPVKHRVPRTKNIDDSPPSDISSVATTPLPADPPPLAMPTAVRSGYDRPAVPTSRQRPSQEVIPPINGYAQNSETKFHSHLDSSLEPLFPRIAETNSPASLSSSHPQLIPSLTLQPVEEETPPDWSARESREPAYDPDTHTNLFEQAGDRGPTVLPTAPHDPSFAGNPSISSPPQVTVHVTIGRVQVGTALPPAHPRQEPPLNLGDYLKQRNMGKA